MASRVLALWAALVLATIARSTAWYTIPLPLSHAKDGQPPGEVQITESRDYGIYHMAFFGTPRGDIGASRTPISVWMWIKCFKSQPTPENPLSTMQLQGTFIHFYTADPNWIMTDHPMISAEHGLFQWKPNITIGLNNQTTAAHGKSNRPHQAAILVPGKGPPDAPWPWDWDHGKAYIPSAFMLNITDLDLQRQDIAMRVEIEGFRAVHFFSTGYCQWFNPEYRNAHPRLVMTRKPSYNVDLEKFQKLTSAHITYHHCLGFDRYVLYAFRDQLPYLVALPDIASLVKAGILELVEWPFMQYPWNDGKVRPLGAINGVAQDTFYYSHTLLGYWNPSQKALIYGCDIDELLSTPAPIQWPTFFEQYPQSVLVINSSLVSCSERDPKTNLPYLHSCAKRAEPGKGRMHVKSFLDAWRIQMTDQSHIGAGFDQGPIGYVRTADLLLLHIWDLIAPRPTSEFEFLPDTTWQWVLDAACYTKWTGGSSSGHQHTHTAVAKDSQRQ